MDTQQMVAIVDATSLARRGRVAEATALIQRTLADGPVPAGPVPAGTVPAGTGATDRDPARLSHRSAHAETGPNDRGTRWSRPVPPFPAPPAASTPGRFDTFSYTNAAGTRAYRVYVPTGHDRHEPRPLVVMLHGGTQDSTSFAAATAMNELAERQTFLVAYPEQPQSANPGRYWNWFVPEHQRRDAGEPSLVAGITHQVVDRYQLDAERVYVAGFSAGGAMAAVMAAVYPDVFAAVGVHSGLAYGVAADMTSAFAAMSQGPSRPARYPTSAVPLIVFHGDRDTTVAPTNAEFLIRQALATGASSAPAGPIRAQVPGGHGYTRTCYQDPTGATVAELWTIHGGGHHWFGGAPNGSYTDPRGPDASGEFVRFFQEHPRSAGAR
jgi:poly(hydroxyalkanoate) depolymerase family esterase